MDVDYTHTYDMATGPFDRIVPAYYYQELKRKQILEHLMIICSAIKEDNDENGKGFATGSTGQEKDIIEEKAGIETLEVLGASNEVTVSNKGMVKALKEGSTKLTLTCGKASLELNVTVVKELVPTEHIIIGDKSCIYLSSELQFTGSVKDQFGKERKDLT